MNGGNGMKIKEYEEYLKQQGIPSEKIENRMSIIGDFVKFLTDLGFNENIDAAGKEDVDKFMHILIKDKRNTLENITCLGDYAYWIGYRKLYVALIEVMDCHNALDKLVYEIEKKHGKKICKQIFNKALPQLGANETERGNYTRNLLKRITGFISPEESREAWFRVQHGLSSEFWFEIDASDKEKFSKCEGIDEFLNLKRQERNALLKKLHDEKKPWYTIEITDEVLEFIKSDPEIEGVRRDGNRFYITKVPYNAGRYLKEKDNKLKRYYACHCPLVRDAILQDQPVSPDICYCSLGHASHYLAGLGLELKGEVLESAIKGDTRCRFVFYKPNKEDNKAK